MAIPRLSADLKMFALRAGLSVQEVVRDAIRRTIHDERRDRFINHILDEDSELLHRLSR